MSGSRSLPERPAPNRADSRPWKLTRLYGIVIAARLALVLAVLIPLAGGLMSCAPSSQSSVERIPLETLFGNPDKTSPRLSYDGEHLTYVAPLDGVLNIWLKGENGGEDRPLTHDDERGIKYHLWAKDNEHVLYVQDQDGDENWRVYAVHVASGETRLLAPTDTTAQHPLRAQLLAASYEHPELVVIGLNRRDQRVHDAYTLNVQSGELTLLAEGDPSSHGWVIDNDLAVRGWLRSNPEGGSTLMLRPGGSGPYREAITWTAEDELASGPVGFAGDNRTLYLHDSRDRNAAALYAYDTVTGEQTLLAGDPTYDAGATTRDPQTHEVQAVSFVKQRRMWTVLDPAIEDDIARLREHDRGDFEIASRTRDDQQWIIYYAVDDGSGSYHRYDRSTGEIELLFHTQPELEELPLVTMEPIQFEASDGMTLHGYLTLPRDADRPMPLVLNVHGGPWHRDTWGYDPEAQWLANRGYACLQVNFRGSTGYGKDYLNAGDMEWGARMQDDLTDGVQWAIDQGIADPERLAIYGGSYGGYAALAGAAFTPDLYSCAISVVGPSSLVTLLSSIPPYWASFQQVFDNRVGRLPRYESGPLAGQPKAEEDWTEADRKAIDFLKSRSPLYHVDDIEIPMLIGQGANDPRVKQVESDSIVSALEQRGIEVDYVVYEDEGHGFARPENRIDFYRRADQFLARHLGSSTQ